MGALKYVVIGVVVVVVVATALVSLLPTLHRAPVHYVGSPAVMKRLYQMVKQ